MFCYYENVTIRTQKDVFTARVQILLFVLATENSLQVEEQRWLDNCCGEAAAAASTAMSRERNLRFRAPAAPTPGELAS